MALTRSEMDRKIDEHFGFEAQDDVAGVLATLSADVEHDIVGFPTGPTHGREAARGFYEALFTDLSESKVKTLRRYLTIRFFASFLGRKRPTVNRAHSANRGLGLG